MKLDRLAFTILSVVGLFLGSVSAAVCCPFCSAPSLTKSEEVAQSDAVVLVQWVEGKKTKGQEPGNTTYEIVQVVKGPGASLKKGKRITLVRYRTAKKGDLFLLMGTQTAGIEWGSPLEVTETSFNYIAQAPSPEDSTQKRLAYYLKFLEFPDQLVSNDAYAEFANAPYKDITSLADVMPRNKIRKWITNPDTPATRLGLYGLFLGLCGEPEDADLMKKKITEPTDDFRLGIDGVMFGYLLLTGKEGLDLVDRLKLKSPYVLDENGKPVLDKDGKKKPLPFSETYSAMQALRSMWTYGEGRIDKERLRQSMRILLDRPELADLVIANLSRWEDWSVQDKLMDLYGAKEYNIPSIKRAIIRYMLVSSKDAQVAENIKPPAHVIKGRKHMAALRKQDPKTVREAERFFFLK
ncbi:MAG: hypothetical protein IH899_02695 [Planctomycetes bacterium]|nr:hypothetical protein [Planctomycetota bacterium]